MASKWPACLPSLALDECYLRRGLLMLPGSCTQQRITSRLMRLEI
jgi:hypothetical protein